MPTQKQQASGYMVFMREKQEEFARNGEVYNLPQLVPMMYPLWKEMPTSMKDEYKEKARVFKKSDEFKAYRERTKKFIAPKGKKKCDSTKTPLEERVSVDELFEQKRKVDLITIAEDLKAKFSDWQEFVHEKLILVAVEPMVKIDDDRTFILPAEIGIVNFSLAEGIIDQYYCFPASEIPIGFVSQAKVYSEQHHQIPPENFENSSSDWGLLFHQIVVQHFGGKEALLNGTTRLYCLFDNYYEVKDGLDYITSRAGEGEIELFEDCALCCIEDLYEVLTEWALGRKPAPVSVKDNLRGPKYDFIADTRCHFHDEQDVRFCALATAKKTAYHLFDQLQIMYNYQLTPQHIPTVNRIKAGSSVVSNGFKISQGFTSQGPDPARKTFRFIERGNTVITVTDDDHAAATAIVPTSSISCSEVMKLSPQDDCRSVVQQSHNGAASKEVSGVQRRLPKSKSVAAQQSAKLLDASTSATSEMTLPMGASAEAGSTIGSTTESSIFPVEPMVQRGRGQRIRLPNAATMTVTPTPPIAAPTKAACGIGRGRGRGRGSQANYSCPGGV